MTTGGSALHGHRLLPLDEVTDLVTVRMDGPLHDSPGVYADEETAAAAWLVAETVRYLNDATAGPMGPGLTEPSTAFAVAGALAVAATRVSRLASQLATWLEFEAGAGHLDRAATSTSEPLKAAVHAAAVLGYAMGAAADELVGIRSPAKIP